jgi:phosphoribosylformylglycinamidine synthase
MSNKVTALIITGYGTNCEIECEYAVRLSGADQIRMLHFSALRAGEARLDDYNFLVFPGGFLDGDDLGAAQAAAQRWRYASDPRGRPLLEQLKSFMDQGGIAIGICNGFQLMTKLGILPALEGKYFERQCSLALNASARFEDRWCHLKVNPASPCVITKGLDRLYLPVRHGEGRFLARDAAVLDSLLVHNQVALQYIHPESGEVTQEYPHNPNGALSGIAGICDPSGRFFGLMPHPESLNHPTNHPGWTRGESSLPGTVLFENGVRYLRGL